MGHRLGMIHGDIGDCRDMEQRVQHHHRFNEYRDLREKIDKLGASIETVEYHVDRRITAIEHKVRAIARYLGVRIRFRPERYELEEADELLNPVVDAVVDATKDERSRHEGDCS